MNGTGRYGLNMLRQLTAVSSALLLCGCNASLLPGMQNLNTAPMRKYTVPQRIHVQPTLIQITPTLIADQRVNTYFYHIAPADVLNIEVWQHPEFQMGSAGVSTAQTAAGQSGYLVSPDGKIYFPLVGYVTVVNKTVDQVRREITSKLEKYVPNPQVNVRVADFRGQKIYVLGEVAKTGFIPITDQQLTIADALSQSGWFLANAADTSNVYVIRGDYTRPEIFWLDAKTPDKLLLAEHFSLQPRDILFVSTAPIAQINRVLDQFLPLVESIWFTKSLVNS